MVWWPLQGWPLFIAELKRVTINLHAASAEERQHASGIPRRLTNLAISASRFIITHPLIRRGSVASLHVSTPANVRFVALDLFQSSFIKVLNLILYRETHGARHRENDWSRLSSPLSSHITANLSFQSIRELKKPLIIFNEIKHYYFSLLILRNKQITVFAFSKPCGS